MEAKQNINTVKTIVNSLFEEMAPKQYSLNDVYFADLVKDKKGYSFNEHLIAVVLDVVYQYDPHERLEYLYNNNDMFVYEIIKKYMFADQLYEKHTYVSANPHYDTYMALDANNDLITFDMIETIFNVIDIIDNINKYTSSETVPGQTVYKWGLFKTHLEHTMEFDGLFDEAQPLNENMTPDVRNLIGSVQKYWK
jgi:hypothetical protein